jgi:hypothetical protein
MYNLLSYRRPKISVCCAVSMLFGLSQHVQFEAHKNPNCLVNILLRQRFCKVPVGTEKSVDFGMGRNQ